MIELWRFTASPTWHSIYLGVITMFSRRRGNKYMFSASVVWRVLKRRYALNINTSHAFCNAFLFIGVRVLSLAIVYRIWQHLFSLS